MKIYHPQSALLLARFKEKYGWNNEKWLYIFGPEPEIVDMKEIQNALIQQAQRQFGAIEPCRSRETLNDCFSVEIGKVFFWFNTPDNSTHLLTAELA